MSTKKCPMQSIYLVDGSFLSKETDLHIPAQRHADPPNLKSMPGEPSKCLSLPRENVGREVARV